MLEIYSHVHCIKVPLPYQILLYEETFPVVKSTVKGISISFSVFQRTQAFCMQHRAKYERFITIAAYSVLLL